jgi:hypothetical protein
MEQVAAGGGSALTPANLSLPTQSHTEREGEREGEEESTGGVAPGQGDTG